MTLEQLIRQFGKLPASQIAVQVNDTLAHHQSLIITALLDGQLHKGTLVQRLENVIAGACTAADADIRAGHHAQRLRRRPWLHRLPVRHPV